MIAAPAAGFLRGAYVGASDSCKYAETLAIEVANRTIHDPKQRQQVGVPPRWVLPGGCSTFRKRSM